MPVPVDHDKRRYDILATSLELFTERGYAGVTFRDIAQRCGIARTTIYRYFDDKRQIFSFAIRQLTRQLDSEFRVMLEDEGLTPIDKIRRAAGRVLDLLFDHKSLLTVIFEYLLHEKQLGADVRQKVRRHTIGMQLLLTRLVAEGVERGEFRQVDPEIGGALLHATLESAVAQLAVAGTADRKALTAAIDLALEGLQASEG